MPDKIIPGGVKHFRFLDDHFTMNKERLTNLSIPLSQLGIHYRCSSRSDSFTEVIANTLVTTGCEEVGFGIESADNNVLHIVRKKETVSQHEHAILTAKEAGLKTKAFFMAGLPGETWDTIKRNKEFIEKVQPDKIIVTMFVPYPGNDIHKFPGKYGVKILNRDYSTYIQTNPTKSVIETDVASNEELNEHFEDMIKFVNNERSKRI